MKKLLILGTILLTSCSAYKIQVVNLGEHDYYIPMERKGLDWKKAPTLYYGEQAAREHVEILRQRAKLRRLYRRNRYIRIK